MNCRIAFTFWIAVAMFVLIGGPLAAQQGEREALLEKAEKSVEAAMAKAAADPLRPIYHYRPLAYWTNDPNGTIFHDGKFHVFHQFNPYGDGWGNMHWGHAETQDLVTWTHRPIAIWPSKMAGEDHVFSGCAAHDAAGNLLLFYTSVGDGRPNEQWLARPTDPSMTRFEKWRGNPYLTVRRPGGEPFGDGMRDPFIFRTAGRTFMVVGADSGDRSEIPLYETTDPGLADWTYRGIVWSIDKQTMRFLECPNLFPLDGRFVLLLSPYRAVEYRVGDLNVDEPRFTVTGEGKLDHSDHYYATNIAYDEQGRCILFGWIRGFPEGRGWNGVLSVPRVLSLDDQGRPVQRVVETIEKLHGQQFDEPARRLSEGVHAAAASGDALHIELEADIPAGARLTLHLRRSADGARSFPIQFTRETIETDGVKADRTGGDEQPTKVTVLLDRSVVEVFTDGGRTVFSRAFVTSQPGDDGVALEVQGGVVELHGMKAWTMKPVMTEADAAGFGR